MLNRLPGVQEANYDYAENSWIQAALKRGAGGAAGSSASGAGSAAEDPIDAKVLRAAKYIEESSRGNRYTLPQAAAAVGLDVDAAKGRYNAHVQHVKKLVARMDAEAHSDGEEDNNEGDGGDGGGGRRTRGAGSRGTWSRGTWSRRRGAGRHDHRRYRTSSVSH